MLKNIKWTIAILFVLTLLVRLIIAINTYTISSDGPLYIEAATYYYNGEFKQALSHPYHPFYPFLMSIFYKIIGNWEWAGMLISIILSSLAVIPLYLIGIKLFEKRTIAIISSLLYAFHPHLASLSSGILTTGTFIFLTITSTYFFIIAVDTKRYRFYFLTSILALLAFLTRPDGILILFAYALYISVYNFKGWWQGAFKEKSLSLLSLTISWLILALPYLIYLIIKSGEVTISSKLKLAELVKMITPIVSLNSFYIVAEDLIKAFNPWIFLLIIIGIILPKNDLKNNFNLRGIWVIWTLLIVYILALIKFADVFSRISTRYTTPLVAITIFWGTIGLYILASKIARNKDQITPLFTKVLSTVTIITIISFSVLIFKPVGKEKLPERQAGEWITQYHTDKKRFFIISDSNRIAYYGKSKIIRHYEGNHIKAFRHFLKYKKLISRLKEIGVTHLVIEKESISSIIKDFSIKVNSYDLEMLHSIPYPKKDTTNTLVIYKIKYPFLDKRVNMRYTKN